MLFSSKDSGRFFNIYTVYSQSLTIHVVNINKTWHEPWVILIGEKLPGYKHFMAYEITRK